MVNLHHALLRFKLLNSIELLQKQQKLRCNVKENSVLFCPFRSPPYPCSFLVSLSPLICEAPYWVDHATPSFSVPPPSLLFAQPSSIRDIWILPVHLLVPSVTRSPSHSVSLSLSHPRHEARPIRGHRSRVLVWVGYQGAQRSGYLLHGGSSFTRRLQSARTVKPRVLQGGVKVTKGGEELEVSTGRMKV